MRQIDNAVLVDRYGRRRRVVICAGLVVSLPLVGWLVLLGVGVLGAVSGR